MKLKIKLKKLFTFLLYMKMSNLAFIIKCNVYHIKMFQKNMQWSYNELKDEVTDMSKKMKSADDFMYHIYIHMNEVDQFVIFSDLTLQKFMSSVGPLQNLLLLKHNYEDGSFNMHTQLDFIMAEEIPKFVKKIGDSPKSLCWIDFVDEKRVNQLTPIEQAELLYLSHKKEPIRSPFSTKLQNRYVYFSSEVEKMSKIYFKNLNDSELLISNVFNSYIQEKESTSGFWRRKSKATIPSVTTELLNEYRSYAKDGSLFSLFKSEKTKEYYIEIRNLAEYSFVDEVWDDLGEILKNECDEILRIH